jgi:pimeloyl-ACP methyl ester carboxylesterase
MIIPILSASFHVIAPDYPGFGQSSFPDQKDFTYTFENLTTVIEEFVETLGLNRYSIYLFDYGAPIGLRLALRHPERVQTLIAQNGNAYEEGLSDFWDPMRNYWNNPTQENRSAIHELVEMKTTRWQYENGVHDRSLLDPVTWTLDQYLIDRPGNAAMQLGLFYDYRTNVLLYPQFQAFFRRYQPPTIIVWGGNDVVFPTKGAAAYQRDLKTVEMHVFETGHFALETHGLEIGGLIKRFLLEHVGGR